MQPPALVVDGSSHPREVGRGSLGEGLPGLGAREPIDEHLEIVQAPEGVLHPFELPERPP